MLVDPRHAGRGGRVLLVVTARHVEGGARHRRLRVLVAPTGRAGLRVVAARQLGPRTTAARQLRPTAPALLGSLAGVRGLRLRGYGTPAAERVLATAESVLTAEGVLRVEGVLSRPTGARGLEALRGARSLAAEPGTRTGRSGPALRRYTGTLRSARSARRTGTTALAGAGQRGARPLTGVEATARGGAGAESATARTTGCAATEGAAALAVATAGPGDTGRGLSRGGSTGDALTGLRLGLLAALGDIDGQHDQRGRTTGVGRAQLDADAVALRQPADHEQTHAAGDGDVHGGR